MQTLPLNLSDLEDSKTVVFGLRAYHLLAVLSSGVEVAQIKITAAKDSLLCRDFFPVFVTFCR